MSTPPSNHPQLNPRRPSLLLGYTFPTTSPLVGEIATTEKGIGSPVFVWPWAARPNMLTSSSEPISTEVVDSAQSNSAPFLFPFELIKFKFKSSSNF
jgi:hypothetical protein